MVHSPFTFLVVAEDGTSHEHHSRLRTGEVDELLRRAVGGWLASIPIGIPSLFAWCDEDGSLKNRRPNLVGSRLVARLGGGMLPLLGPIVVTGRCGTTVIGLTAAQVDQLLAALSRCR